MKKILFTIGAILGISIGTLSAQNAEKQFVEIKTSAVCGMCKTTIENALDKVDGIKYADLDVETKVVSIKYDATETTVETIKKAINMAGYAADDMPADPAAYEKLHGCCKAPHD